MKLKGTIGMEDLLSVVIPVYNDEIYLRECLDSVINQTYKNLDIVIVDDGSIDSSGYICDEYGRKDSRITVIHQENGGMIAARTTGVRRAKGKYIVFIDSDDFIDTIAYEEIMGLIIANDADMVTFGCYRYVSDSNKYLDICNRVDEGLYVGKEVVDKIFPVMMWEEKENLWLIDPSLCMKIFRKELITQQYEIIKGQTFFYGEDAAVIYPAMLNMNRIFITQKCFYYHRVKARHKKYILSRDYPKKLFMLYEYLYDVFSKSEYADILIRQLDMHYIKSSTYIAHKYEKINTKKWYFDEAHGKRWLFPYSTISKDCRLVLFGAGIIGRQYYQQLTQLDYCSQILWVDQKYEDLDEVSNPELAQPDSYDYVLIAIKNKDASEEIKQNLLTRGWDEERVIQPDFDELEMK